MQIYSTTEQNFLLGNIVVMRNGYFFLDFYRMTHQVVPKLSIQANVTAIMTLNREFGNNLMCHPEFMTVVLYLVSNVVKKSCFK